MKRGLDSRPPTDAQIAAAKAAGYEVWAGYLGDPGDGIDPDHLWSSDRFDAVKAAGMATFAYVSGAQDPARIRDRAAAIGILIAVDVERFIRPDGDWLDSWLPISGSGLYGNGSVHYNSQGFRKAAFHIFAGYYGYDPGVAWPAWLPRDASPCAWQDQGTTDIGLGISVDLTNFEDGFFAFGAAAHELSGGLDMAIADEIKALVTMPLPKRPDFPATYTDDYLMTQINDQTQSWTTLKTRFNPDQIKYMYALSHPLGVGQAVANLVQALAVDVAQLHGDLDAMMAKEDELKKALIQAPSSPVGQDVLPKPSARGLVE